MKNWEWIVIAIIVIIVVILILGEMRILNCYPIPGRCKLDGNAQNLLKQGKSYACIEKDATKWTRAFFLGFLITLFLLFINKFSCRRNTLLYFLLCWFVFSAIIYFYFSFYAYHRTAAACKAGL